MSEPQRAPKAGPGPRGRFRPAAEPARPGRDDGLRLPHSPFRIIRSPRGRAGAAAGATGPRQAAFPFLSE